MSTDHHSFNVQIALDIANKTKISKVNKYNKNKTSDSSKDELVNKTYNSSTHVALHAAIILNHLWYWHKINSNKEHNIREGRCWTYNTVKEFQTIFPYMTMNQIRTAFATLKHLGYVITGNFNKMKMDKTKWYSLTDEALGLFKIVHLNETGRFLLEHNSSVLEHNSSVLEHNSSVLEHKAIPDIITDLTTNNSNNIVSETHVADRLVKEKKSKRKPVAKDKASSVSQRPFIQGNPWNRTLFLLMDKYPVNRRGNLKTVAKEINTLSVDELKLTLVNLKRYLNLFDGKEQYIRSLTNYIADQVWTNEWLDAEEKARNTKTIQTKSTRIDAAQDRKIGKAINQTLNIINNLKTAEANENI